MTVRERAVSGERVRGKMKEEGRKYRCRPERGTKTPGTRLWTPAVTGVGDGDWLETVFLSESGQ